MTNLALSLIRRLAPLAGVALAISLTTEAQSAQVGTLRCDTSIGIGEILVRKQTMTCTFTHSNGRTENYTGAIDEYGVEIGMVEQGHLVWGVVAATPDVGPGLLAGRYVGASASVAAGLGVGANALVGGTGQAFSLQPISVEAETGINIAAGVASVTLVAAN